MSKRKYDVDGPVDNDWPTTLGGSAFMLILIFGCALAIIPN